MKTEKVQTNLKLSKERAVALDVSAAVEHADKAKIVEEALALREALMGPEYQQAIRAAVALRVATDPNARFEALEALREEVPGATPGGSVSVSAVLARLQQEAVQPA